jgi:hypothetical protein
MHAPGPWFIEEQLCPVGQPLPPVPRQPDVHPIDWQIIPERTSPQSESVTHPGAQVLVVRLQTGVGFAHCESTRHCTQVRDEELQIGVATVHADPLVAEHWTH